MGFPENILTKDEKVVRSLHPHALTMIVPALLALLIIAAAWLIVAMTPVDDVWDIVDWVIIGLAVLLLAVFVIVPLLTWRSTHYVITTKRVAVRRGVLSKSGQDIALSKITDVSFRQSFLDRLIRSGSLHIETAGDSQDEDFANIPRSNEVQQLINRLIEDDAARRGGYGQAAHAGYEQMGHRHAEFHQRPSPSDDAPNLGTPAPYLEPAPYPRPAQDPGPARDRPADAQQDGWETPPLR